MPGAISTSPMCPTAASTADLPSGEIETVVPKRRGVGGMVFHADGGLVVGGRNVQHVRDGEVRVLFEPGEGGSLNDLHTDHAGRIYTGTIRSDPFSDTGERVPGECWRIDGEGRAVQLYDDVTLSNGIGFSPDGNTIYHADTGRNQVVAHDVTEHGCTNRRAFVTLERGQPDGLAVDAEGGVWVACYQGGCVAHFDSKGELLGYLEVPATAVTSLCFGGDDMRDLYIVTADNEEEWRKGSIFHTRAPVAGLPTPLATV
ncbi:MAG: SMP-30/gluconolactonase/LRE family protein [Dehalococcoidia bacterium]|nr:SMP-30/gluconolactonase/LRE family protein [Dehalococcoidia bacterium]